MSHVVHLYWCSVMSTIIAYFLKGLGIAALLRILRILNDYFPCLHRQFGLSGIFTAAFQLGGGRFIIAIMGLVVLSLAATAICVLLFVCISCGLSRGWGTSL